MELRKDNKETWKEFRERCKQDRDNNYYEKKRRGEVCKICRRPTVNRLYTKQTVNINSCLTCGAIAVASKFRDPTTKRLSIRWYKQDDHDLNDVLSRLI